MFAIDVIVWVAQDLAYIYDIYDIIWDTYIYPVTTQRLHGPSYQTTYV